MFDSYFAMRSRGSLGVSRSGQPSAHEISVQSLGIAGRVGQRDVSIRPNEINRTAGESGARRVRRPGERVDGQPECGTGFRHGAARLSVHVNLPDQRLEWGEIILLWTGLHP